MYCSNCGSAQGEGAAFCSACGRPLSATAAQAAMPGMAETMPAAAPEMFTPAPTTPQMIFAPAPSLAPAARPMIYAGFWLRFVAWIIDSIVLQVGLGIPIFVLLAPTFLRMVRAGQPIEDFSPDMISSFVGLNLVLVAGSWLYYALMECSTWQGTLGKKALGLYVTDMAGDRITFGRASGRYFGKIISGLTILVGYIMAGFTAHKQALHDMMAGCLVLRKI